MIIYAILYSGCKYCSSVNKFLNYLNNKSNDITYIAYYANVSYIFNEYLSKHESLKHLRFPMIFIISDNNKIYNISSKIRTDAISFEKKLTQTDYSNLNINKFVNKFVSLK